MDKSSVNVLVADDDKNAQLLLCDIVHELGFKAAEATDGVDALEKLSDNNFDLLLLDLSMPRMTGIEVLKRLNEKRQTPEVIVVTSHATIPNAVKATQLGAYDFVAREEIEDRLPVCIRNALAKRRLEYENIDLKKELAPFPKLLGESKPVQQLRAQIEKVAQADCTVLIRGESGSGKELVACEIHLKSLRKDKAFVTVNCSALPETLLESELFGHVKGSFTHATANKKGKFEVAHEGTIFLDEIGDMSLAAQAKVLRVLMPYGKSSLFFNFLVFQIHPVNQNIV